MSEVNTPRSLRQFNGHPGEFWSAFLSFSALQIEADASCLLRKSDSGWQTLSHYPRPHPLLSPPAQEVLIPLISASQTQSVASLSHPLEPARQLIGLRLESDSVQEFVALYLVSSEEAAVIAEKCRRLTLLADCFAAYQQHRELQQTEKKLNFLADLLALRLALDAQDEFLAAAMTLVNTTASHQQCSRVSLGWLDKGYIKLQATSQMDRFAEKSLMISDLEAAMEEAFDQDEEILSPASASDGALTQDHLRYAQQQAGAYLLSLPLRIDGQSLAILTCERQDQTFSLEEQIALRLLADQVTPRLAELKLHARSLRARLKDSLQKTAEKLLGPEHSLVKLSGLLLVLVLLASSLINISYRIEAPFILRSEDVHLVSAPVDGYIEEVYVSLGQKVATGELLLSLDNRDLHLEESAAQATQLRFLRESEKARGGGSLIDMKIAQAQTAAATAQLDLVRSRLDQMQIRSLLDGIIVEGDLHELRGTPVSKGDILFKVARLEKLFAEVKIAERDVHEVAVGQTTELAFIGRPDLKYRLKVEQLDPIALADESGNIFLATAKTAQAPADWWRPGMSGVAKVEAGKRSLLWIFSHRTIDFLRLLIWW